MTRRSRGPLLAVFSLLTFLGCASTPTVVEPTIEDKFARVLKLEDERWDGGGELLARLGEPEPLLRARAALALGRIGDARSAAGLVALLSDPAPFVRSRAAFALGLLEGPLPESAWSALVAALDDSSPRVRGRAAEALARKYGSEAAEPIGNSLLAHLPSGREPHDWTESIAVSEIDPAHFDLRLGLFALAALDSPSWTWNVLATEGRTPRFVWWPAAWTAAETGTNEFAPLFLFYAGSPDPVLRLYGARGLGDTSPEQGKAALRQLLFDPNEKVRIEAIRSVARLALNDLTPDVVALLEGETRYVQIEVLKALTALRGLEDVEVLIDHLGHESGWVRGWALRALARQDPDSFWLLLSGLGPDRDARVRASVAETLGRLGGTRPKSLLESILEDEDANVRAQALRSLARHDPDGAVSRSIRHLSAPDAVERIAAAEGLAVLRAEESVAPLVQAFLNEEDSAARRALLEAIHAIDPDRAASLARDALDDTDYLVRRKAASVLQQSGDTDVVLRPLSSVRSVEEYAELESAPFTPQAFVTTNRGTIELELFISDAPLTVARFMAVARAGGLDGLGIEEVLPNGLVRTGAVPAPAGDPLRSEVNGRPFVRGTVASTDEEKDTGLTGWFITHLPRPELAGRYTVFGHVTRGMEIVDRLEPGDVVERVVIWDGVTPPYSGS